MGTSVTEQQKFVAVALVRDDQDRILVQRRIDKVHLCADGKWEFPGGCVEFGEDPAYAAARETLEETGFLVEVGRVLPVILSRVWERADGGRMHAIVVCYECRFLLRQCAPADEHVAEWAWRTPEEIASMDCLDGIPIFLAAARP